MLKFHRTPSTTKQNTHTSAPRRLFGTLSIAAAMVAATATAAPTPSLAATSTNVNWWGWTPTVLATANAYIAAFNKVYPNIHVTFRQIPIASYDAAIRPALASSVGPDVFDIAPGGGIGSIAYLGTYAMNIRPVVEKALGSDWQSKIAPIGVPDMTTSTGTLAALSVGQTYAGTLWINQNLFSQYGLKPPTNLASWAHVCSVFKQHNVGCFVQGVGQVAFDQDTLQSISDSVQPGVWTKASRGEVSWDNPTIVQALSIWKELFSDGIMEPGSLGLQQYPDANNDFMSSKFAMVMMGTWFMNMTTPSNMTAAISAAGVGKPKLFTAMGIPFPDVAGYGHPSAIYGDSDYGLAVNSKSSNKTAATTFVTWLTTTRGGQQVVANTLNEIASLKGVSPQWQSVALVNKRLQEPMLTSLIARASSSSEPRLSLVSSALQQAIGVAATSVALGQATPKQAAETLQKTMTSSH